MQRFAFLLPLAALLPACGTLHVSDERDVIGVRYGFERRHACGTGPYSMKLTEMSHRSPELRLDHLPPDTRKLTVEMVDLDLLSFKHGKDTVPAAGPSATLPEGALASWLGPCPPTGYDHRYEMRVQALDAQDRPLAAGKEVRTCCKQFEAK